ncbi:MAG: hypothetical protein ACU4EQ_02430 [Candidatus Nitrosoglobus sp.]
MTQELVWGYFQKGGKDLFSSAHRRLEYLSKRVFAEESVLNIGVGNGLLKEMLAAKGISVSVLGPMNGQLSVCRKS